MGRQVHDKIDEIKAQPRLQVEAFQMPYMDETDPQNPYGPNYERLSYSAKKYYKFLKVKQYVHMAPEDATLLRVADCVLYGGLLLGLGVGVLLAKGGQRVMQYRGYMGGYRFSQKYPQLYFGLIGGGCATETYWQIGGQYGERVVEPLYAKYHQESVQNGFQDYEISCDLGYGAVEYQEMRKS